ncbi:hypothetical protein GCM10020255_094710 [Rhodococcus baikonurensis]
MKAAQAQLIPFDKNYLRSGDRVSAALGELESLWGAVSADLGADPAGRMAARQAAAITAVGRWMYHSTLARTETRGMSKRDDYPELDVTQHHHVLTGGLDSVWTRTSESVGSALVAS